MLFSSAKVLFERNNLSTTLFAFFVGAFFLIENTRALRISLVVFIIIPFLVYHYKEALDSKLPANIVLLHFFLCLCLASLLWSTTNENTRVDKVVLRITLTFFFIQTTYFFFLNGNWSRILNIIITCAFIAGTASIFYFYQEAESINYRLENYLTHAHPVITGNFFAFALVLSIYQLSRTNLAIFKRLPFIIAALVIICVIILTQSRGALLALVVAGTLVLSIKSPKYLIYFASIVLLASILYWLIEPVVFEKLFSRGASGRFDIYKILIARVSENRFLGLGITANDTIFFNDSFTSQHTHSIFLASYYHLGFLGLGLHLLILCISIVQALKIYFKENNWLPLTLLIVGSTCLLVDGAIISTLYKMEWLLFLFPVSLTAAFYYKLNKDLAAN